jgi:hypothetical protein
MTRGIDVVYREAAQVILEQLAQRRMHRAILRAGAEQDARGANRRANAHFRQRVQLARRGHERERSERGRQPSDERERFKFEEDAGRDTGRDRDCEDDGCVHATPCSKRRGAAIQARFGDFGRVALQFLRRGKAGNVADF